MIIIHIGANTGSFVPYILVITIFGLIDEVISVKLLNLLDALAILFTFGRLLVLPIVYKKLENSQKFDLVAKFIQKLKKSFRLKIVVLIVAYFSFLPYGWPYIHNEFRGQLIQGIIFGLLGNYLILFAYWFIEDKVKNIKK